jgi:hypothetical protein
VVLVPEGSFLNGFSCLGVKMAPTLCVKLKPLLCSVPFMFCVLCSVCVSCLSVKMAPTNVHAAGRKVGA